MAKYLFHGSYTQAGIQGVLKDGGTGRRKAVDALATSIGGSVESMYWAFGADDFYVIADLPSHAAAAALAATTGAAGAVSISTVVLLTSDDMDEAIKLHPNYRVPGA
ncbi:MAG: GYD domain-containing protein [Chloroflexota bacterium]